VLSNASACIYYICLVRSWLSTWWHYYYYYSSLI